MVDRIAAEDLDPLAPHDFRDRGPELHGVSLPGAWPVGPAGWGERIRNYARRKARAAGAAVGQLCIAGVHWLRLAIVAAAARRRRRAPQQVRSRSQIRRLEALGEAFIDRGEQSDSLDLAAGPDPVCGEIGGDAQFKCRRSYGACFGECLLQPLFQRAALAGVEKNRCVDPQKFWPAPALALTFLMAIARVMASRASAIRPCRK